MPAPRPLDHESRVCSTRPWTCVEPAARAPGCRPRPAEHRPKPCTSATARRMRPIRTARCSGGFLSDGSQARRAWPTKPSPTPGRHARTLPTSPRDRRGRHGLGLAGRADDVSVNRRVALKIPHAGLRTRRHDGAHRARARLRRPASSTRTSPVSTTPASRRRPALPGDGVDRRRADHALRRRSRPGIAAAHSRSFCRRCRRCAYAHARLVVHRDLKPSNMHRHRRRPGEAARLRHRPSCSRIRSATTPRRRAPCRAR